MNNLLTAETNWDIAYNRLINRELWELIKEEDANEDFLKVASEIKDLINLKEWIANMDQLKQRIWEIILKNKSKLPNSEYFIKTLRSKLYTNHRHLDLLPNRWESELEHNIDICLNKCINESNSYDSMIKEIIIYEIMRQWAETKRKNEETLMIFKKDTAEKTIHYLKIDDEVEEDEDIWEKEDPNQLTIEFPKDPE